MFKITHVTRLYFIASRRLEHKEPLLLLFTLLLRVNHSFVPMNDLILRKMSKNWIKPPNSWKHCSRFRFIQNTSSSRDWSSAVLRTLPATLTLCCEFYRRQCDVCKRCFPSCSNHGSRLRRMAYDRPPQIPTRTLLSEFIHTWRQDECDALK